MKKKPINEKKIRIILFIFTALLHAALLFFVVFNVETAMQERETPANLISLLDIQEDIPPPPREPPPEIFTNTTESIAETMIETDEEPPDTVYEGLLPAAPSEVIEFISQSRVTDLPKFPDDLIRRAVIYPPIARSSNLEGRVILELFVDRYGNILNIVVLLEEPENRGFGEAAVEAFKNIKAEFPALVNGEAVAVRYRYPLRFTLR